VTAQALTVRGLRATRGGTPVLRGVDLDVASGEICALMGVSGAGKSTVLRAIAALQPFSEGSIVVDGFALQPGQVPPESRLRPLRSKVGFVFQAHSLFEHLTVMDNLTLAPIHAQRWTRERARGVAVGLLETLGVAARAEAYPRQLSGGEAQRVAIARALALDPHLLLKEIMGNLRAASDAARRFRRVFARRKAHRLLEGVSRLPSGEALQRRYGQLPRDLRLRVKHREANLQRPTRRARCDVDREQGVLQL